MGAGRPFDSVSCFVHDITHSAAGSSVVIRWRHWMGAPMPPGTLNSFSGRGVSGDKSTVEDKDRKTQPCS